MQVILHRVSSRGDPSRRRSVQPPQALEGPELALEGILWGNDKKGKTILPDHWSGLNLPERTERIDKATQDRVAQGYDMRNFAVHTGLLGVVNFEKAHLEMQCALSLKDIGECAVGASKSSARNLTCTRGCRIFSTGWMLSREFRCSRSQTRSCSQLVSRRGS